MIISMMKVVDLSEANAVLAEYALDPHHEPVILAVKGKPIAVVLSAEGGDVESISVGLNPAFNAFMKRAERRAAGKPGISADELRREFGLPPYAKTEPKTRVRKTKTRKSNGEADGRQV